MSYYQDYSHISFRKSWTVTEHTAFLLGRCEAMVQAISNTPIDPNYRRSLYLVSLRKGAGVVLLEYA